MPNSFQPHIPKWKGLCIPNEGEPLVPPLCRLVTPQVDQAKDLKIAIRHARAESMGFKETRIKTRRFHCSSECGGITISRRPNKCPSTENAPGPSNPIANAMITIGTAAIGVRGGAGIQDNNIPKTHKPTTELATGVMNPMIKPTPLASNIDEAIHTTGVRPVEAVSSGVPSSNAIPPRAARSRSNPTPGPPLGKVENSLCSGNLPLAHTTGSLTRGGSTDNPQCRNF
jgi:hypothetical protein